MTLSYRTIKLGSTGKYDIIAETEWYTYFKMRDDVWALLEKEAEGYYFDDGAKRFYQREIDYMISIGYTFESAGDGLWKAVRK